MAKIGKKVLKAVRVLRILHLQKKDKSQFLLKTERFVLDTWIDGNRILKKKIVSRVY